MCTEYISVNGERKEFEAEKVKFAKNNNKMLPFMYEYMEKKLPNAHVLDYMDGIYGDENHAWGLAIKH